MGRKRENQGCLVIVVAATIALPVLYVLAIGPAHWLMDHAYIRESSFEALYGSFIAAGKKSPPIQNIVVWYIDLWHKPW